MSARKHPTVGTRPTATTATIGALLALLDGTEPPDGALGPDELDELRTARSLVSVPRTNADGKELGPSASALESVLRSAIKLEEGLAPLANGDERIAQYRADLRKALTPLGVHLRSEE